MEQRAKSHEEIRDDWSRLVGGFILAFGDIELVTHILWRDYYPNEVAPNNFKDRATKLMAPLKKEGGASENVANLLVQALRLATKRNTVAHEPLQAQVFRHSKTGELFTELAISSEVSEEYITDKDLESLQLEARKIGLSLYQTLWPKNAEG